MLRKDGAIVMAELGNPPQLPRLLVLFFFFLGISSISRFPLLLSPSSSPALVMRFAFAYSPAGQLSQAVADCLTVECWYYCGSTLVAGSVCQLSGTPPKVAANKKTGWKSIRGTGGPPLYSKYRDREPRVKSRSVRTAASPKEEAEWWKERFREGSTSYSLSRSKKR